MLLPTGTLLNNSAATHASVLYKVLEKYSVEPAALKDFLATHKDNFKKEAHNIIHENPAGMRSQDMNISAKVMENIKHELKIKDIIDKAISSKILPGTYSAISTQFENSILFVPTAQTFYRDNIDLVKNQFPEIETIVVNSFYVPANKRPYGVHNAGSIAFQMPEIASKGYGYPKRHVSYHTAVTPTPLDKQPLVVFEDAVAESPNTIYMYENAIKHEMTAEERNQLDTAIYLLGSGKILEVDVPAARDFLLTKYWEKKYAKDPSKAKGYYCDLIPGQALVFDNYRPHGDSTIPISNVDRVTIDLRCFSKVEYPDGIKSGVDLVKSEKNRTQKRDALEFILMILGYDNLDQFAKSIYGKNFYKIDPFVITTDLQFAVYNKDEYFLADQNLDVHYEKVMRLYEKIEKDGEFVLSKKLLENLSFYQLP